MWGDLNNQVDGPVVLALLNGMGHAINRTFQATIKGSIWICKKSKSRMTTKQSGENKRI